MQKGLRICPNDRLVGMLRTEIADPIRFLDDARRALDKCHFVATLETLPGLAGKLSEELNFEIRLGHHNKSQAPLEIADIVMETVERENKLDMALYEHARALCAA